MRDGVVCVCCMCVVYLCCVVCCVICCVCCMLYAGLMLCVLYVLCARSETPWCCLFRCRNIILRIPLHRPAVRGCSGWTVPPMLPLPLGRLADVVPSRRRDCHSTAPPSPFSTRINSDGERIQQHNDSHCLADG